METVAHLVSAGELAWIFLCTLLVTETVAHHVSGGGLACILICTVLVTEMVACLVSGCKLHLLFNVHSSGDRDSGLSCFSW